MRRRLQHMVPNTLSHSLCCLLQCGMHTTPPYASQFDLSIGSWPCMAIDRSIDRINQIHAPVSSQMHASPKKIAFRRLGDPCSMPHHHTHRRQPQPQPNPNPQQPRKRNMAAAPGSVTAASVTAAFPALGPALAALPKPAGKTLGYGTAGGWVYGGV